MQDIHPYQYHPITRRKEIRLLQILPDSPNAIIKCRFKASVLRKQPWMPHYTTISYTWGSATRDKSIILDGHSYSVTTSVYQILNRIRREDKSLLIWIDSVCINQDDNEEKSKQIMLMKQIYSMASETVAWIGKAGDDSHLAIRSIKKIGQEFGSGDPCWNIAAFGENILTHARSETGIQEWKAIEKLLSRRWFHRVWVLQEVALSNRLVIYCGDDEFLWDSISQFGLSLVPVKATLRHQLGLDRSLGSGM
jgi:hypothetical protein